jgi:glycosyltransferase involved in cell wall biosynthesis
MKIAIIAPSAVPFCIGGAEYLWWSLLEHNNQNTPHQADLIKLPSREQGFWELIASYENFAKLDLRHFDMVISGKYPAWMAEHPHHVCYMLHRLRGLYDTYHFSNLPEKCSNDHPAVRHVQQFIQKYADSRQALMDFFAVMNEYKKEASFPQEVVAFPGPFIYEIIHYLDDVGLAKTNIGRYAAISRNVKNRQGYFPDNAQVLVAYPPSKFSDFVCRSQQYLLSIGRLDGAKRTRLLIEAMHYVKDAISLKIAGTGPAEQELKQLAAHDPRIQFLGFVNEARLLELYADALGVVYVPYDEDYGLVTIEAMMSAKPVITVADAGGVLEFVVEGETGYIAQPTPASLAEKIAALTSDRQKAAAMGKNGYSKVKDISWQNVTNVLLGAERPPAPGVVHARPKLIVTSTFPIYPPRGGGQSRIFHLYRHLARKYDIILLSVAPFNEAPFKGEIAPGMQEIRIPKSRQHHQEETELSGAVNGQPITDVAMPRLYSLTPEYVRTLSEISRDATAIVASHPFHPYRPARIGFPERHASYSK